MYELNSRVRYSETDVDARLSVKGIMNYMQDCSTMQSEDAGVGIRFLKKEKKAWLLSSWQIQIIRRPELGEEIHVVTWPYDFKGIYGLRSFAIFDTQGRDLVKANSCWFLFNTENGCPMRVTKEDADPYGNLAPRIAMADEGRKILMPKDMEEGGKLTVMGHLLDTNHHVNNAQYIEIAREALPVGREISEIRAEYKKAAVLGDQMLIYTKNDSDTYFVSLRNEAGETFANVKLVTAKKD